MNVRTQRRWIRRVAAMACVSSGIFVGGCGSASSHMADAQGLYPGVRSDLRDLTDPAKGDDLILVADLPFSAALDTVLLPLDLINDHTGPTSEPR